MTGSGIELHDVRVHFGATVALDGVTASVLPGTICGLLGRNGSGKTTLLSMIAAFRRPSGGSVQVDGEAPWENPRVLAGIALVREGGDLPDVRVGEVLLGVQHSRGGVGHPADPACARCARARIRRSARTCGRAGRSAP